MSLRANLDGSTALAFDVAGAATIELCADIVVLALPFSTLRNVDLCRSGLSAEKRRVIASFGMGTNAKIHLELVHKDVAHARLKRRDVWRVGQRACE